MAGAASHRVWFARALLQTIATAARRVAELRALARLARVGRNPVVRGGLWVHGAGRVVLGDRVVLDGSAAPIELHAEAGAEIIIGDDVRIEGGTSLEAARSIVVGARSVLGPYCKVLDNNRHPVAGDRHRRPPSVPVVIGEDAVLGPHSIVLPGAQLGRAVRLEEGTVVSRRVPDAVVLAGNPPRVVRAPC